MPNDNEPIIEPINEPTVPVDINAIDDVDELRRIALEKDGLARRFAKDLKQLKSQPITKPEPKIDEEIVKDVQHLKLSEKKRQFGYQNTLSPEETDKLFQFAGDKDPSEALKDPFFQAGLAEHRRSQRVANAVPSGSNRVAAVEGKSFKEMNKEEREKNWNKITGQA